MNWNEIIKLLHDLQKSFGDAQPPSLPMRAADEDEWWHTQFSPAWEAATGKADAIIEEWVKAGSTGLFPENVKWILARRFDYARELACYLRDAEKSGLLNFSEATTQKQILRWLLVDAAHAGSTAYFHGLMDSEHFDNN
ncbi:MAG TPA: hypothetical protein VHG71_02180 [Verrucomicrobiae bacterium]|nr:hypothetical protein [Verrucomicrobiae bacterium]